MRGQTPSDNARIVGLEILMGNRGAAGDRAVRLREVENLVQQALSVSLSERAKREKSAELTTDTAIPTSGVWVSGPSVVLDRGVWQINALALIKTSVAGSIAARLFNGVAGIIATQQTHPATTDYFTSLGLVTHLVLPAQATITLQVAPSVTSAVISMLAETTIGGALPATRLTAVQIGA